MVAEGKDNTQEFVSPVNWYTLRYPRTWDYEVVENIPSFFDPYFGKGALQALAIQVGSAEVSEEILQNYPFMAGKTLGDKFRIFLHMQELELDKVQINEFPKHDQDYVAAEYVHEKRFYMAIMIQKGNTVIFLLYNSAEIPEDDETKKIIDIIDSIRIN